MGCTPDAIVPSQRRLIWALPLSVDPSSMVHLVCPMSPRQAPYFDPRVPETFWSKCLIHYFASVVAHRDERSWVDLLTRPPLIFFADPPEASLLSGLVGRFASFGSRLAHPLSSPAGSGLRLPSTQSHLQPHHYPHSRRRPPAGMHSTNPGTSPLMSQRYLPRCCSLRLS